MSRAPPDIHGMTSLKVDNLTYCTTVEDLRNHFEQFGEIGDVYIPRDRRSHESRGFAFVRYTQRKHAERAIHCLDGTKLDGRKITVQMAKYGRPSETYRRPRGDRYGGGSGRYGDRGHGDRYGRSRSRSPVYRGRYERSRSRSPYNSRVRGRPRSPASSSDSGRGFARGNNRASRSRSRSFEENHNHHQNMSRSRSEERYQRQSRSSSLDRDHHHHRRSGSRSKS